MEQLLKRWAAAEPDRCVRNWPDDLEDHAFQAGVLYAILKNIEARGPEYALTLDMEHDADCWRYEAIIDRKGKKRAQWRSASRKSFGHALLAAYLQAIEAVAEVAG